MKNEAARKIAAIALAAATAGLLGGCGNTADDTATKAGSESAGAESAAAEPTAITVAIDAGLEQPALDAFAEQVEAFEQENPDVDVTEREYTWTGTTFAAELAGGTLPDVFTIPFTDGRSLIQQEQIADISELVAELPYAARFNEAVIANGQADDGRILALPTEAYGQALHYNRTLFEQAGLDPDEPPTSWPEVREAARQIAEQTGQTGFGQLTQSNTGGWILTTLAYSLGGRAQEGSGEDTEVTVDTPAFEEALQLLHDMRWEDNSMGSNFLYDWNSINQAFASGQIGMYVSGGGNYDLLVSQNAIDPADYGETVLPLEGEDAGVLGGGTLAVVSAEADDAVKEAAVRWIDFFYMRKLFDEDSAVRYARTQAEDDQAVGAPDVPVFDRETYEQTLEWIAEYINVPTEQMEPYTSQQFDQPLLPEPARSTQELYAELDPVVQAVLTDESADIPALLEQADGAIQAILDSA